jgi:hypothetical protein
MARCDEFHAAGENEHDAYGEEVLSQDCRLEDEEAKSKEAYESEIVPHAVSSELRRYQIALWVRRGHLEKRIPSTGLYHVIHTGHYCMI